MDKSLGEVAKTLARWVLIVSSLFALYTSGFGLLSALTQRSIHWLLMSVPVFLLYPATKKNKGKVTIFDFALALLTAVSGIYLVLTWEQNAMRIADPALFETIMGVVMIVVVLEACRRTLGPAMTIIAVIALVYAFFGPYFPGMLRHKGFTVTNLVSFLYSTTEGIFGLPMGTSATYIIVFVLFGAFLSKSGAGQLFVDLALSLTGRARSGPAQTTILSNALMGIISGSPVANVVTTGAFTLPLLSRTGYPIMTGAALLAVAATGSMFTPPVMGAGAFMIADYLSVPYGVVVKGAIIPAALFYISLILHADIAAVRTGLKGLDKKELPSWKNALAQRGHLLVPVIALVFFIVIGWSALKTAFWCILLMVVLSWIKPETRMNLKRILDSLEAGSRDNISIAAACAAAGIIVGVVSATGLGVKFSSLLNMLSGNSPILALLLTMLAALILGMGLPPTAVYIILAALTIPSLIGMGLNPLAAHFFVFFYACVGAITPPVCLAAYSAAAVAKTEPFATGWKSFRMGLVAYIIPFLFVLNPVLLMQNSGAIEIVWAFTTGLIGVTFLTFGVEGFFKNPLAIPVRVLLIIGSLALMVPDINSDLIGVGILVLAILSNKLFLSKAERKGS